MTLSAWQPIRFNVLAMDVPVYTKDAQGKRVRKRDETGAVITDKRLIPKERPRSALVQGKIKTHTASNTLEFEKWIRRKFFDHYPGNCGVYYKGKPMGVHSVFVGCEFFSEPDQACTRYRDGPDFIQCRNCSYRRRNLGLDLDIFLDDDRSLDVDNIIKVVLDSLNKVCFYDDSQFIRKSANLYTNAETEHMTVSITPLSHVFELNCLRAGYKISSLTVEDAGAYIKFLYANVIKNAVDRTGFFNYIRRCDKRAYTNKLIDELRNSQ